MYHHSRGPLFTADPIQYEEGKETKCGFLSPHFFFFFSFSFSSPDQEESFAWGIRTMHTVRYKCIMCVYVLYLTYYIRCTGIGATRDQVSSVSISSAEASIRESKHEQVHPPFFFFSFSPTTSSPVSSNQNNMSKLPNSLKALINAPKARPNTVPAPPNIRSVYQKIQQTAQSNNVSQPAWLALSVSATFSVSYTTKGGKGTSMPERYSFPSRQPPR